MPAIRTASALDAHPISARSSSHEPIALVGLACRLPGGIDSPRALWKALLRAENAVIEVPRDRWDAASFWDDDPKACLLYTSPSPRDS